MMQSYDDCGSEAISSSAVGKPQALYPREESNPTNAGRNESSSSTTAIEAALDTQPSSLRLSPMLQSVSRRIGTKRSKRVLPVPSRRDRPGLGARCCASHVAKGVHTDRAYSQRKSPYPQSIFLLGRGVNQTKVWVDRSTRLIGLLPFPTTAPRPWRGSPPAAWPAEPDAERVRCHPFIKHGQPGTGACPGLDSRAPSMA